MRHDVEHRRVDGAEGEAGATPVPDVHHGVLEPVGVIEKAADRGEDLSPFAGQASALARTLEQRHAERALQLLDLLAQRRLRHSKAPGRPAEMALLGDGHEGPEVAQQAEIDHGLTPAGGYEICFSYRQRPQKTQCS